MPLLLRVALFFSRLFPFFLEVSTHIVMYRLRVSTSSSTFHPTMRRTVDDETYDTTDCPCHRMHVAMFPLLSSQRSRLAAHSATVSPFALVLGDPHAMDLALKFPRNQGGVGLLCRALRSRIPPVSWCGCSAGHIWLPLLCLPMPPSA